MPDEWSEIVLHTIEERAWKDHDGKGFGAWVIQKVRNGKSYDVQVRAGMFKTDAVTGLKVYPRDGLSLKNFESLNPIYKTVVKQLLSIPKDTPIAPVGDAQEPEESDPFA